MCMGKGPRSAATCAGSRFLPNIGFNNTWIRYTRANRNSSARSSRVIGFSHEKYIWNFIQMLCIPSKMHANAHAAPRNSIENSFWKDIWPMDMKKASGTDAVCAKKHLERSNRLRCTWNACTRYPNDQLIKRYWNWIIKLYWPENEWTKNL